MIYQVWAYYRGGADGDFQSAVKAAARRRDDGSGQAASGLADISFSFPTKRGALGAARRIKAVYPRFRKSGHIEMWGDDAPDWKLKRRLNVKAARRRTSRRR